MVTDFVIQQDSVQGDQGVWPLALEMRVIDAEGQSSTIELELDAARARVADLSI